MVFVELVIVMPPHIAEKSVFETHSVANVKAIINLVHEMTIPKEKLTTASISAGDFDLIVHGSACAAGHFGM